MTMKPQVEEQDIWERLSWIWSALFYVTLIIPTALVLFDGSTSAEIKQRVLILTTIFALLHLGWIFYLRSGRFQFHGGGIPVVTLLYLLVSMVLWFLLIVQSTVFYLLLFSLYSQVFGFVRLTYSIPLAILLMLLVSYSQVYDGNLIPAALRSGSIQWFELLIYAIMVGAGLMFAAWINAIINQSAERRVLIAQLQQAQDELAESERQAGRLAERERLARDIHDTLAQGFSSIVMNMEAAEQALPDDIDTVAHHIDITRNIARTSLEQARRVVADLRPELLEQEPLPQAIERFVGEWGKQTGVQTSAVTTGSPVQLHPQIEVTLLRATQEALANVQNHAQADRANVTLSYLGDVVILDVQDDGVGIGNGRQRVNGSGFGLTAMRERVEQLQGELTIETSAEDGTTISVQLPTS